ncbi:site-specific recombinase XerD [Mesobacillus stamsii]|uniref:Site-specific recombinase XerD n=1 Tax=Mesobacillus stamsii TaxID=225347 RepID=A0ABU0FTW4_9BACI|nr:site-specific recombinase XerD [Mesobacillus stamsii]
MGNISADKRIEGFSPYTIKAYGIQARLLVLYFKDAEIGSISTANLKKYLNHSAAALKPSSMAHRIRFMKSLFRWCHEDGHMTHNPAVKIKEPKVGKRIPKFLTEKESELFA